MLNVFKAISAYIETLEQDQQSPDMPDMQGDLFEMMGVQLIPVELYADMIHIIGNYVLEHEIPEKYSNLRKVVIAARQATADLAEQGITYDSLLEERAAVQASDS